MFLCPDVLESATESQQSCRGWEWEWQGRRDLGGTEVIKGLKVSDAWKFITNKLCLLHYPELLCIQSYNFTLSLLKQTFKIQSLGYIIQMLETLKGYSCICFKMKHIISLKSHYEYRLKEGQSERLIQSDLLLVSAKVIKFYD